MPTNSIESQLYQVRFSENGGSVLVDVQLNLMTRMYTLTVDGQIILEVDAETPDWLPVRPAPNRRWLRTLIMAALRNYFGNKISEAPVCWN